GGHPGGPVQPGLQLLLPAERPAAVPRRGGDAEDLPPPAERADAAGVAAAGPAGGAGGPGPAADGQEGGGPHPDAGGAGPGAVAALPRRPAPGRPPRAAAAAADQIGRASWRERVEERGVG